MIKKYYLFLVIVLYVTSFLHAKAGGPLIIKNGMALSYDRRPLVYRYDKGKLGTLTNAEAIAFVSDLFSLWESVPTAQFVFNPGIPETLDVDINAQNFEKYLNPKSNSDLLGFTPIVFDEDGTLFDALLGNGASNGIAGVGGPVVIQHGSHYKIAESQISINGKLLNGIDTPDDPEVSLDSFRRTVLHETGHAIGLDHSQINVEATNPFAEKEITDSVPLMFPRGVNDVVEIKRDEASALSFLYPNESELTKYGKIEGKVFREDGITPVLGANVILRNVNDPLNEAISCVSDFLTRKTGAYQFTAVPPGKYTIEIEPIDQLLAGAINEEGVSGSVIGPYSKNKYDESFKNPVPKGFYTGANFPIIKDKSNALLLEIKANETIKDADIVAKIKELDNINKFTISINGPDEIVLKGRSSRVRFIVSEENFSVDSNCKVYNSSSLALKIKPASFVLGPEVNEKSFVIELPQRAKLNSTENNTIQDITITVNCSNSASINKNLAVRVQ